MLAYIFLVLLAGAQVLQVSADTPCQSECTIGSGYTSDKCSYYMDNNDWLPPKYAAATYCVCSNDDLNSPPLKCVRKQLQLLHDSLFSDEFKAEAKNKLDALAHGMISQGTYDGWSDMAFGGVVKQIHDAAFSNCCCLGAPASSYWWHSIFVWPAQPCFAIRTGQKLLSACDCDEQG